MINKRHLLEDLINIEKNQNNKSDNLKIEVNLYDNNRVLVLKLLSHLDTNNWTCELYYNFDTKWLRLSILGISVRDRITSLDDLVNKYLDRNFIHKLLKLFKVLSKENIININDIDFNDNTLDFDIDYEFMQHRKRFF